MNADLTILSLALISCVGNIAGGLMLAKCAQVNRRLRRRQKRLEQKAMHYSRLVDELEDLAGEEKVHASSSLEDPPRKPKRSGYPWLQPVRKANR